MITIGIDPGKSGAIAIMENGSVIYCEPLPFIGDELDTRTLSMEILNRRSGKPCKAVLEKVHAMPGQGVCSMFTFGKIYGELRGMLKTLAISIIEPTPQAWKKEVLNGSNWKDNKAASCEYVMKRHPNVDLTPGRKKNPHDGMADAVCLAEFRGDR